MDTLQKNLIIITYDMNSGEWLENEVAYHKGYNYNNIVIFNTNPNAKENDTLSQNTKVFRLAYKRWQLVFSILLSCFSPILYKEIAHILKVDKKQVYAKIKRALSHLAVAGIYARHIDRELKNSGVSYGDKNVFYAYWMSVQAETFFFLRNRYKKSKFVTRCHRVDLYEEMQKESYLEYRQQLIDCLDAVFSISQHGKEYLQNKYECADKCKVARLGSMFPEELKEIPSNSRDVFKIVSCSSVTDVKRVEMIPEILSHIKDSKIVWHHYGDGPKMDELREAAKRLPSNIEYELKGNVAHDKILEMYNEEGYHLFINVSTSEGIPVSIMEALSMGIPVIATDVGGVSEIIQSGENGFLVPLDCGCELFAQYFRRMIAMNDIVFIVMQEKCREMWRKKYDVKNNYDIFARILWDML